MRTQAVRRAGPLLAGLALVLASSSGCGGGDDDASNPDRDQAIAAAQELYQQSKEAGARFDSGPCLSEELPNLPDWVADIVHDPREAVDNEPANQCRRFRDGEASHFVELSTEGELIRAE